MPDRRVDEPKRDRIDEIAENYAKTDAEVLGLLTRQKWTLRLMLVLVVLGLGSSYYFYGQNRQRAQDNRASIATAQRAIVSGCELLSSAVRQVGIAPARKGESKASRLNRVLTVTVIDEVLRTAPPSVRARVAGLYHRLLKAGAVISLPDCQSLAELRDDPKEKP